jgi:hypothetical protein
MVGNSYAAGPHEAMKGNSNAAGCSRSKEYKAAKSEAMKGNSNAAGTGSTPNPYNSNTQHNQYKKWQHGG